MKKYLTAAFLLVMTLFLCACGADVNSTVTVNPDESGERVMVMTISKNDLKMAGKFKNPCQIAQTLYFILCFPLAV